MAPTNYLVTPTEVKVVLGCDNKLIFENIFKPVQAYHFLFFYIFLFFFGGGRGGLTDVFLLWKW